MLLFLVSVFGVYKTNIGRAVVRRVIRHVRSADARFDPVIWKDTSKIYSKPYVRSRMVGDLLKKGILSGMSRQDVRRLLGKPESDLGGYYHYFLHPDGWGDAEVLAIEFNSQGRVRSAKLANN